MENRRQSQVRSVASKCRQQWYVRCNSGRPSEPASGRSLAESVSVEAGEEPLLGFLLWVVVDFAVAHHAWLLARHQKPDRHAEGIPPAITPPPVAHHQQSKQCEVRAGEREGEHASDHLDEATHKSSFSPHRRAPTRTRVQSPAQYTRTHTPTHTHALAHQPTHLVTELPTLTAVPTHPLPCGCHCVVGVVVVVVFVAAAAASVTAAPSTAAVASFCVTYAAAAPSTAAAASVTAASITTAAVASCSSSCFTYVRAEWWLHARGRLAPASPLLARNAGPRASYHRCCRQGVTSSSGSRRRRGRGRRSSDSGRRRIRSGG